jgi:hypothetical protein
MTYLKLEDNIKMDLRELEDGDKDLVDLAHGYAAEDFKNMLITRSINTETFFIS